jgi:hypothetical protein
VFLWSGFLLEFDFVVCVILDFWVSFISCSVWLHILVLLLI